MFLTQEEFNVLSGKIFGLSNFEISQKLKISETSVKITFGILLEKYGATDSLDLVQKANLNQIQISENPPYYNYEKIEGHKRLVKKIQISKQEFMSLAKFFENVEDEEFELIFDKDPNNFYKALYVKNLKTNEKTEIYSEITD